MAQHVIQIEHVWKTYKINDDDDDIEDFHALKDTSVIIDKGEFSALLGPSGSGKSTLMHIIGLLDKPTKGKVIVNGKDAAKLTDDQISSLRNEFVGFVFQQFNLINKLTVLENVLLPSIYARQDMKYDPKKKAMEILERFGIGDKAKSYPNKISGGQQQRVAIARSLIMSPQLILADEPTGNLDSKTGSEIMKLLNELNKKDNITILVVTHEKAIADKTKRKIEIVDGEIVSS